MSRKSGARRRPSPVPGLRARLDEAEATLAAIRTGAVDAVVVMGPRGERTLAIEGATHPYHVLLDAMTDGAALMATDGTMLFGNRRLGEIARAPVESLQRSRFQQLVVPAERPDFEEFLRAAIRRNGVREFAISGGDGSATPVSIALSTVPLGTYGDETGLEARSDASVLMAIVTDLSERKRAEATRLWLMNQLISAEDQERRRFAQELHDETGQSLAALQMGLRAIEDQPVRVDVQASARRLRSIVAETLENVGRLARGLHPSALDDMGLVAATRRHVSDYAELSGVSVDFRFDGVESRPLPPLVQSTVYRILQEALTNVARHAKAKAVLIRLKYEGTLLELVVRDDGVGFDANAAFKKTSGLGLHGMQERVAVLSGSVEIESRPGHGTTVSARVPAISPPPPPPDNPRAKRHERPR